MSPKREAGSNARMRRRVREMTSKRLSHMVILTGLVLVLTACTSPAPPSTPTASAPPPTSAGTVVPTPSPTEPRLDPVPQHCPVSNPTPHVSLPGLGPVVGASPVWADWPPGGPVIAHLSHAPPGVYEAPFGYAEQGVRLYTICADLEYDSRPRDSSARVTFFSLQRYTQ